VSGRISARVLCFSVIWSLYAPQVVTAQVERVADPNWVTP
ncbi:uncharacterized protein METZ01_LOCUS226830, partial [marine metagenome]